LVPDTTLRAAYFETVKRTTTGGQTIEPTQVAGFNQLFDDFTATKARRWGVGIDHKQSDRLYIGAEWSQRQLAVPVTIIAGITSDLAWHEEFGRGYISWLPSDRLALTSELQWERIVRAPLLGRVFEFAEAEVLRLPFELRWFEPSGAFALARTTLVRERGQFATSLGDIVVGDELFATVDFGIGWRWPGRAALATLEIRNLLDSGFQFQDTDPLNPRTIPARQIFGRISVSF
jgi:hypothetical protein